MNEDITDRRLLVMKRVARKVFTYLTDGMKAKNMAGYDQDYLIKRIKGGIQ